MPSALSLRPTQNPTESSFPTFNLIATSVQLGADALKIIKIYVIPI